MPSEDLASFWMPFTANRAFKRQPRLLVAGRGMHYTAAGGREILDATSGLWCVNAGHARREIADAVHRVLSQLGYATSFQMGHPAAFELADRLAELLPGELDRVFFTNSGSESVDTALKIARAYQRARGAPERRVLVGRERSYHGVNFGGLSVGGLPNIQSPFGPLLPDVAHLPHTHDREQMAFSRGQPVWGAERAEALEEVVAERGAGTIAAVIVEPVAGAGGVLVPPNGYLERLRAICDRHDILLIFDEVITAFGRLGAATAAERFGIVPDMITMAKGLTNGAIPMGAVGIRRYIGETILDASPGGVELPHGYTYSGHPAACAAGLATLSIYRDEGLFARAAELEPAFEDMVHGLRDAPGVIDVRNLGLMGAIELEPAGNPGARGAPVMQACFDRGLLVRLAGDTIALSPALIAEPSHFERIGQTIADVLHSF